MAGALTISTLNDSSGVLATQNGMSGIAKAWVSFNGSGGATINASFNVSSVSRVSTGTYTINFTTAMPDANYSVASIGAYNRSSAHSYTQLNNGASSPVTTTSCYIATVYPSNTTGSVTTLDQPLVTLAIFR